jgi:uncharacterized protein YjbI with pentapeptide repeats
MKSSRFALVFLALTIAFNLALSATAFAHGQRWRGPHNNRKWEKFANGHDARDGRRDERGPRFRRAQWRRDEWRRREWRNEHFRNDNFRNEHFRNDNFRNANFRDHRRPHHRRF